MEVWADRHGDVIVHTPDSLGFTLPYHEWGHFGRPSDPHDPARCAFLTCFEAHYLHDRALLPTKLPEQTKQAVNKDSTRYRVYAMLRKAGWTVRSGLQFGGDFLLYRGAPGSDHAPYVVVVDRGDGTTGMAVAGMVRAAAGARKQVVLASPCGSVVVLSRWVPEQERMRPL